MHLLDFFRSKLWRTPIESVNDATSNQYQTWVIVCFSISIFVVSLDSVIITTALPTIITSLRSTSAQYTWIGSVYLLANAAFVPIWGNITNAFGVKKVLAVTNVIFIMGAIVSASSKDTDMLLSGRVVQGLASSGVNTCVQIYVSTMFQPRVRGLVLGIIGAVWAIASALGPVLGGIFAERLNWRWCFWSTVVINTIPTALLCKVPRVNQTQTSFRDALKLIDWLGAGTIIAAVVMLLLGFQLMVTEANPGSAPAICLLIAAVLCYLIFLYVQYRVSARPILPPDIFPPGGSQSATLSAIFCDAMVFNALAFFLPLYLQKVVLISPLHSGVILLAMALPLCLFSALAGWYMQRTGYFIGILRAGLVVLVAGMAVLITTSQRLELFRLIPSLVAIGIGFGPNFHAPLIAMQVRIDAKDIPAAIAAANFVRMLGGAMGIVICQLLSQVGLQYAGDTEMDINSPVWTGMWNGTVNLKETSGVISSNQHQENSILATRATAVRYVWIWLCSVSFCGLLASICMKNDRLDRDTQSTQEVKC